MVYTVTLNPAIDLVMHMDGVALGEVNRSRGEEMYFGGKGINVSAVLRELGVGSVALGFVAGFTGEAIERGVRDMGVGTDFVRLGSGCSRINVKLKAGQESEFNGNGPEIGPEDLSALMERLDALGEGDTLVLAGSVPGSVPEDIYEQMLRRVAGRGVRTVVDAAGELLMRVLPYGPFLVKPNLRELEGLFGVEIGSVEEAKVYGQKLRSMGAKNVLVSMAGDGALLLDEGGGERFQPPFKGEVRNSVGAGDSMVAGFTAGAILSEERNGEPDYGYALRLGAACGGATAFSDGLAKRELIDGLMES